MRVQAILSVMLLTVALSTNQTLHNVDLVEIISYQISSMDLKKNSGLPWAKDQEVCDNMWMHSNQTHAMAKYASGSTYTAFSHHMEIALWISKHNRPFAIVEDKELLEIFTDLNPNYVTSTQHTVSRDIQEIFSISHTNVGEILKVCL